MRAARSRGHDAAVRTRVLGLTSGNSSREMAKRRRRGSKQSTGAPKITSPPSPDEMIALYDAGMTLYLKDAGTDRLNRWHTALAADLGHPETKTKFSLFASRRSAGTSYHFDALENFTIQLRGHKRWHIAPNRYVTSPMVNWFAGQPVPAELELHAHRPLPKSVRGRKYVVDLRPGDVLYIPRGYWHSTETGRDSLSAFVGFQPETWADFVAAALAARLRCEPAWRKNVIASWSEWECSGRRLGASCPSYWTGSRTRCAA